MPENILLTRDGVKQAYKDAPWGLQRSARSCSGAC